MRSSSRITSDYIVSTRHPSRPQRAQYSLGSSRAQSHSPHRRCQTGSTMDISTLHDQDQSNSPTTSSPGALESLRTRLAILSAATAPTPRHSSREKQDNVEDHYESTEPPELLYNSTAPPSYDTIFGPDAQPSSKRAVLANVLRTVGRELVGGKK